MWLHILSLTPIFFRRLQGTSVSLWDQGFALWEISDPSQIIRYRDGETEVSKFTVAVFKKKKSVLHLPTTICPQCPAHLNKLKAWRRRRGPAVVWVKLWILVLVHQGSSAPNATRDTNLRDGQPLIYTVKKIYSVSLTPLHYLRQNGFCAVMHKTQKSKYLGLFLWFWKYHFQNLIHDYVTCMQLSVM